MKRIIAVAHFLLVLVFTKSCNDQYINDELVAELKASPPLLNLGGKDYYIYSFLACDYSHPAEIFGVHTSCCITLVTNDSTPVEPGINFIAKYVIKDNMVWKSAPGDVTTYPYSVMVQSHDGPNWGADYYADVVLEFSYQGEIYRLLATKQYVLKIE